MRRVIIAAMLGVMLAGCASVQGVAQRAVHPCEAAIYFKQLWSPDGRQIAYWSSNPNALNILDVQRQTTVKIALDKAIPMAWSPDSKYLIAVQGFDFLLIDETSTVLATFPGASSHENTSVTWSANSREFAYRDYPAARTTGLSIQNIADGSTRRVYSSDTTVGNPAWSPDGNSIALIDFHFQGDDPNFRLMLVSSDGSDATTLLEKPLIEIIQWSPDGRYLAFHGGTPYGLYVIMPDGSGTVLQHEVRLRNFIWLPDSSGLMVIAEDSILHLSLDGTATRISDIIFPHASVFSPDATHIAYVSDELGYDDLYVMNIDGTDKQRLTVNPGYSTCIDWPF